MPPLGPTRSARQHARAHACPAKVARGAPRALRAEPRTKNVLRKIGFGTHRLPPTRFPLRIQEFGPAGYPGAVFISVPPVPRQMRRSGRNQNPTAREPRTAPHGPSLPLTRRPERKSGLRVVAPSVPSLHRLSRRVGPHHRDRFALPHAAEAISLGTSPRRDRAFYAPAIQSAGVVRVKPERMRALQVERARCSQDAHHSIPSLDARGLTERQARPAAPESARPKSGRKNFSCNPTARLDRRGR